MCDLSQSAECVPTFRCESECGPFVREVENAMRNGWEQRCDGNFLTIFAGTIWGEKPNFTGRFSEWRRPFDFSTRYLITPVTADALKKTMEDAEQWDRSF